MNRVWRIGAFGCGVVGKGLLSLLRDKREFLRDKYGFEFQLSFICGRTRGTIIGGAGGIDCGAACEALERDGDLTRLSGAVSENLTPDELLDRCPSDIICDMTPTNYKTGEPSLGILRSALSRGVHAVTCSKGGVSKDMAGLKKLAADHGAALRFESSVMAGTPLINLMNGPLAGCLISRVRGIVNGTTNYILTKMKDGMEYADALAEAQRLGYAETDPSGDVEGFDAAVKTVILAGELFGAAVSIDDVIRTGISGVTFAQAAKAAEDGKCIKLIASVERCGNDVRCSVQPEAIAASDPLAHVCGVRNAAVITTDSLGDVMISGPGAGPRETAHGILSDILSVVKP